MKKNLYKAFVTFKQKANSEPFFVTEHRTHMDAFLDVFSLQKWCY